jgi:hypothetical protein
MFSNSSRVTHLKVGSIENVISTFTDKVLGLLVRANVAGPFYFSLPLPTQSEMTANLSKIQTHLTSAKNEFIQVRHCRLIFG